jgi:hypothetical protein
MWPHHSPGNQSQLLDELVFACALQYADTASVLPILGNPGVNIGSIRISTVVDPIVGMTLQFSGQRVFSFKYEDTSRHLWGFFPLPPTPHRMDYYQVNGESPS